MIVWGKWPKTTSRHLTMALYKLWVVHWSIFTLSVQLIHCASVNSSKLWASVISKPNGIIFITLQQLQLPQVYVIKYSFSSIIKSDKLKSHQTHSQQFQRTAPGTKREIIKYKLLTVCITMLRYIYIGRYASICGVMNMCIWLINILPCCFCCWCPNCAWAPHRAYMVLNAPYIHLQTTTTSSTA